MKTATCLPGVHYRRNERMTAYINKSEQITALYVRFSFAWPVLGEQGIMDGTTKVKTTAVPVYDE